MATCLETLGAKRRELMGGIVGAALLIAACDLAVRYDLAGLGGLVENEAAVLAGVAVVYVAAYTVYLSCASGKGMVAAAPDLEAPLVYNEGKSACNGNGVANGLDSRMAAYSNRRVQAGVAGRVQECLPGELPELPDVGKAANSALESANTAASNAMKSANDAAKKAQDAANDAAKKTQDAAAFYAQQARGGVDGLVSGMKKQIDSASMLVKKQIEGK